jgi:hypothetical protein
MEELQLKGMEVTYRGEQYLLHSFEAIDEQCIHLHLNEGIYAVTLPCMINTKVISTLVEFEEAMQ